MNDEIFSKGSVSLSSFFYDNFKHCDDPKNRAIIDVKEEKKKDSCAAPPSINVVVLRNQSNVVKESGSALKCNFAFERASVPHHNGDYWDGEKVWKNRIDLSSRISVKSNNKENVTTKIFNKKFSGNAKEASGTGAAGHGGGKHHFRKLCRKKSRSWKSWFEGKDLTSTSNNDQYYALLPLDENERSSDLGKAVLSKMIIAKSPIYELLSREKLIF